MPYFTPRTIDLDNARQNNIVMVDLSHDLTETVFQREYKQAANIIARILKQGNLEREYKSDTRTKYQTAVPFIGDRGTGKTSMMYSILERLRGYTNTEQNRDAPFDLGPENDNARFIIFEPIDANTLKRTENLLEIMLSRMLTYLEDFDEKNQYDSRELYRRIDYLYNSLSRIYWKKSFEPSDSGLINLKRTADSQKSIAAFQELVRDFIIYVGNHKDNKSSFYLVLALDDIDMYQGMESGAENNQFSLLEQLYDYMRIPGLIVLMTYNESILKRNCVSHFRKVYFGKDAQSSCTSSETEEIEILARQFMSKLFPAEQRVYLPNLMLIDSANAPNIYIKHNDSDRNQENFAMPLFTEDMEVKPFMLGLIAERTGVYFDAVGTKKHFFEPRNLRELGSLIQTVSSMQRVTNSEQKEAVYHNNRQVLLSYLYNQFAGEQLSAEEYQQFQARATLPIERQDRLFVDDVHHHRRAVTFNPDDFGYLEKAKVDRWRYSYGELLHSIYFATRIRKNLDSRELYYSKEYIHCLLGVHSVVLNQTFCIKDKQQIQEEWRKILGSSIAGRWANEMLPQFAVINEPLNSSYISSVGSMSLPVRAFFSWKIPKEISEELLSLGKKQPSQKSKQKIQEFVNDLVLLGMLFTGFPKNGLKIQLIASENHQPNGIPTLFLKSSSEEHICFNVLNFAINLFFENEQGENFYLEEIFHKLKKLGETACDTIAQSLMNESGTVSDGNTSEKTFDSEETSPKVESGKALVDKNRVDDIDEIAKEADKKEENGEESKEIKGIPEKELWAKKVTEPQFKSCFEKNWNSILKTVFSNEKQGYFAEINRWAQTYTQKGFHFVLPLQHFDMMYNTIKRMADVSYHDVPEEAAVEEVYNYFQRLYEDIARELENQDKVYFGPDISHGFATAFKDSVFYQKFVNANSASLLETLLTEIMRQSIRYHDIAGQAVTL